MPTVKGILRMGVGRYRLELQKRLQGILNDIYYRIHSCDVTASGCASIAGKITV
jgi:hypothetical protein